MTRKSKNKGNLKAVQLHAFGEIYYCMQRQILEQNKEKKLSILPFIIYSQTALLIKVGIKCLGKKVKGCHFCFILCV